jgi:hypothetical protein
VLRDEEAAAAEDVLLANAALAHCFEGVCHARGEAVIVRH